MNYSLSAFFPAYNDGGTIASMVLSAKLTLESITDDYEIIVVNDGSVDYTREILVELQNKYDKVRLIDHPQNSGYGAALRTGFAAATKEFIFYTDGDAQYDPRELKKLMPLMKDGIDVVNGYKIERSDPLHRKVIGRIYHWFVRVVFNIKLRDVDCDFRLIRKKVFDKVRLESNSGVICVELMRKIQAAGFVTVQTPVHHYHRAYGKSQFFNFKRVFQVGIGLIKLWWELVLRPKFHLGKRE